MQDLKKSAKELSDEITAYATKYVMTYRAAAKALGVYGTREYHAARKIRVTQVPYMSDEQFDKLMEWQD